MSKKKQHLIDWEAIPEGPLIYGEYDGRLLFFDKNTAELGVYLHVHWDRPLVWGFKQSGLTKGGWQALVKWFSEFVEYCQEGSEEECGMSRMPRDGETFSLSDYPSIADSDFHLPSPDERLYVDSILPEVIVTKYGKYVAGFDCDRVHFDLKLKEKMLLALDKLGIKTLFRQDVIDAFFAYSSYGR